MDTEDTKQEPISESDSDDPTSELIITEEPRKYGKFKKVVHEYTSNKIKKRILQLLRTSSIKKTEIENFGAVLRVGEHFTGQKLVNWLVKSMKNESIIVGDEILKLIAFTLSTNLLRMNIIRPLENQNESNTFEFDILYEWAVENKVKTCDSNEIKLRSKENTIDVSKYYSALCQNCKDYVGKLDEAVKRNSILNENLEKRKSILRETLQDAGKEKEKFSSGPYLEEEKLKEIMKSVPAGKIPSATSIEDVKLKEIVKSVPAGKMPPPPPLGIKPKDNRRKAKIMPAKKLKPLFWDRLLVPVTDTKSVWSKIDEIKIDNFEKFAEDFQVVPEDEKKKIQASEEKEKFQPSVEKKKIEAVITNMQCLQYVGVKSRKFPIESVKEALCKFKFDRHVSEEDVCDIFNAKSMKNVTAKEINDLKTLEDSKCSALCPTQLWLRELLNISCYQEKIDCFEMKMQIDSSADLLETIFHKIDKICEFFNQNEDLRKILSITLTFGNYINGGHEQRGQADGFRLNILNSLKLVRGFKDSTLLDYIVDTYLDAGGKEISVLKELNACKDYDFKDFSEQVDDIKSKLETCQKNLELILKESVDDPAAIDFQKKLANFLKEVEIKHINIDKLLKNCIENYETTATSYSFQAEREAKEPSAFFQLWINFFQDFTKVYTKKILETQKEKSVLKAKSFPRVKCGNKKFKSCVKRTKRTKMIFILPQIARNFTLK